jgi:TolB protein
MKKHITFLILNFIFATNVFAAAKYTVAVGKAEIEKDKIVIISPVMELKGALGKKAKTIVNIWKNDFAFYKHLYEVSFDKTNINLFSNPDFLTWKSKSIRFAITSKFTEVEVEKTKKLRVHIKVYDTIKGESIYDDSLVFEGELRAFSHRLANFMYKEISGKDSIFTSRVVFVSDQLSTKKKVIKELYIMDFDGRNMKRLTRHNSIVISPSLSSDNSKVIYSLIQLRNRRQNVDLFIYDLKTGTARLISGKKGLNSGGVFSKDNKSIYLTLSFTGNADIYELTLATNKLRRITKHFSDDVDPSVTADGNQMAFLSGRPGRAMIYTSDPRGTEKGVKRISYVGKFNATPRFSPDGKEITFSSWVDERFDIYRIDKHGQNLVRLTKNFGSNEEPSYSKDGQFIVFSSQRILSRKKAIQNLYIMTREGQILGNITQDIGNCASPKWFN